VGGDSRSPDLFWLSVAVIDAPRPRQKDTSGDSYSRVYGVFMARANQRE